MPCEPLYNTATSGIVYFAAAAGTGILPGGADTAGAVFLLCAFADGHRQTRLCRDGSTHRCHTGGVGLSTHARTRFDRSGDCVPFISFNGKCLLRNQEPMFDIIREVASSCGIFQSNPLKESSARISGRFGINGDPQRPPAGHLSGCQKFILHPDVK